MVNKYMHGGELKIILRMYYFGVQSAIGKKDVEGAIHLMSLIRLENEAIGIVTDFAISDTGQITDVIVVGFNPSDVTTDVVGELTSFHLRLQVNTAGVLRDSFSHIAD